MEISSLQVQTIKCDECGTEFSDGEYLTSIKFRGAPIVKLCHECMDEFQVELCRIDAHTWPNAGLELLKKANGCGLPLNMPTRPPSVWIPDA